MNGTISVLLFIATLSILAGSTAAALADVDGGRHRGRLEVRQDETVRFADSTPRMCQAPPADDMSVLMESVAGEGPVRKSISLVATINAIVTVTVSLAVAVAKSFVLL